MKRTSLKSVLLALALAFGIVSAATAQGEECLEETLVSSELAQLLGWQDEQVGLTLMEVLRAGIIRPYCFTSLADCESSQRAASGGVKSGCYPKGSKYCYDLQFASTGNFYGTVTDEFGAALPGVTVTLGGHGSPQVQVTNAQGQFRYLGAVAGIWTVQIELEGFTTQSTSVTIPAGDDATKVYELAAAVEE